MAGLHIMTGTRRLCLDRRRLSYDSRGRRLTIPVDTFEVRWERRKLRVACPAGKPKKPAIGLVCFVLISGSNILPACALGSPCRHTSPDHRRSANTSSIIGLPSTSGSTPPTCSRNRTISGALTIALRSPGSVISLVLAGKSALTAPFRCRGNLGLN